MKTLKRIIVTVFSIALVAFSTGNSAFAIGVVSVDQNDGGCVTGTQIDPYAVVYCNVSDAIADASAGDTVQVAAGNYEEQLVISIDLTLMGAGSSTIIQSPAALTAKFVTSADNYPIIFANGSADVTIKDLVVDGLGRGNTNYRFVGIGYYNAGGTVENVEVKDVRNTPLDGSQHGVAIYVYNQDASLRTVNIYNSNFYGYQKNGMALNGAGLTVNVSGNTTTGMGASDKIAQNGIQIGWEATGTVTGNTVSGHSWTGGTWTAAGILFYASDADANGNIISENQTGITHVDGSGTYDNNTISASAAGTGVSTFWGILVDDPIPNYNPVPFGDGSTSSSYSASAITTQLSKVVNNSFTGDGSAGGIGLEVAAGWGTLDMDVVVNNNKINNWGTAVSFFLCQSSCTPQVFNNVVLSNNKLTNSVTDALYVNHAALILAENNWWGDASGPSGEGAGTGGSITYDGAGNVDFDPWCRNQNCRRKIFANGFESGDTSAWSKNVGSVAVSQDAAIKGNFGAQINVSDKTPHFLVDALPDAEKNYSASFLIDINDLEMNENNKFILFQGRQGKKARITLNVKYSNSQYRIRAISPDDNGKVVFTKWAVLPNTPTNVGVQWQASRTNGADSGFIKLFLNGKLKFNRIGIDNDTQAISYIRIGVANNIKNTYLVLGSFFVDNFKAFVNSYTGP